MFQIIRKALARFARNEHAAVAAEAVLILPILAWAYLASFVYFDAFRAVNTNLKAAYSLSDLLSRETDPVSADYLDGMNKVYDYLANARHPTSIRVSSVRWDVDAAEYLVNWSYATKEKPIHTHETMNLLAEQLPVLAIGDTIIVLETQLDYEPLFNIGLPANNLNEFIVTRPRFAPQLLFTGPGV